MRIGLVVVFVMGVLAQAAVHAAGPGGTIPGGGEVYLPLIQNFVPSATPMATATPLVVASPTVTPLLSNAARHCTRNVRPKCTRLTVQLLERSANSVCGKRPPLVVRACALTIYYGMLGKPVRRIRQRWRAT